MPKAIDLTGRRFGALTVLRKSHEKAPGVMWLCKCACGKELEASTTVLMAGRRTSCGCMRLGHYEDLSGRKFGKLTALGVVGRDRRGRVLWECECECGNTAVIEASRLKSGNTKSCGCLVSRSPLRPRVRHGKTNSRLYGVWHNIKSRCTNPNVPEYEHYGARGISICDEWLDFDSFYEWAMANGYDPSAPLLKCTIDRIDVDGDYCPENCRWVDMHVQNLNKRVHKQRMLERLAGT